MSEKGATRTVFCVPCQQDVEAVSLPGRKAYAHRADLANLQFWQCPRCLRFVGSHKQSGEPLGVIPSKALKEARQHIHDRLDPLWKDNRRGRQQWTRKSLYAVISKQLGYEFHAAELRSLEEARKVYDILNRFYWKTEECPF